MDLNGTPHRMWQFRKGSCPVSITRHSRMPGEIPSLTDKRFLRTWPQTRIPLSPCREEAWAVVMPTSTVLYRGVGRYKKLEVSKDTFRPWKNLGVAVQCTDLVFARLPRIEQHTVMDNQSRILGVSVMNRWLADFLVRSPCGSPVHGLRDRSMGDQRAQINYRTAKRGRFPMP